MKPLDERPSPKGELIENHLMFHEDQIGVTFDGLFGPYLANARRVVVTDPYIRLFFQARNLMELIETIIRFKPKARLVNVHLVTVLDDNKGQLQVNYLSQIATAVRNGGIHFSWEFDSGATIHARHIVTDHGWKITLDRGLDIFQHYEMNDSFDLTNRLQQFRQLKAFEVTFLRVGI